MMRDDTIESAIKSDAARSGVIVIIGTGLIIAGLFGLALTPPDHVWPLVALLFGVPLLWVDNATVFADGRRVRYYFYQTPIAIRVMPRLNTYALPLALVLFIAGAIACYIAFGVWPCVLFAACAGLVLQELLIVTWAYLQFHERAAHQQRQRDVSEQVRATLFEERRN